MTGLIIQHISVKQHHRTIGAHNSTHTCQTASQGDWYSSSNAYLSNYHRMIGTHHPTHTCQTITGWLVLIIQHIPVKQLHWMIGTHHPTHTCQTITGWLVLIIQHIPAKLSQDDWYSSFNTYLSHSITRRSCMAHTAQIFASVCTWSTH